MLGFGYAGNGQEWHDGEYSKNDKIRKIGDDDDGFENGLKNKSRKMFNDAIESQVGAVLDTMAHKSSVLPDLDTIMSDMAKQVNRGSPTGRNGYQVESTPLTLPGRMKEVNRKQSVLLGALRQYDRGNPSIEAVDDSGGCVRAPPGNNEYQVENTPLTLTERMKEVYHKQSVLFGAQNL